MPVDINKREIIEFTDIDRFKPLLYADLYIPSYVHGYSVGLEFIYTYFLNRFPKDFFRTVSVNGSNIYDDFRKFQIGDLVKREKPSCFINTTIQFDFNDNTLDTEYRGIDSYIKRSMWQRSFFKDPARKLYISLDMELMVLNFNIRTRYDTRAQQLDVFNRMKKLFRIGCTETIDVDMDLHVPYDLMYKVASVVGFSVDQHTGTIIDPWNFISYINSGSQLPVLYKLRYINGRHEFFVRMRNLPIHLNLTNQLDVDDGDTEGHLDNNFGIEMQIEMRLPVPKCYALYNEGKWNHKIEVEPNNGIGVYSMKVFDIPEVNYKGWPMYGHSNYLADKNEKVVEKINVKELFTAPPDVKIGNSLLDLIEQSKKEYISPSVFIDIQVYLKDAGKTDDTVPISIDWDNYDIILPQYTTAQYFYLAIYIDRKYVNEKIVDITDAKNNRIKTSEVFKPIPKVEDAYIKSARIQTCKPKPTNLPRK